MLDYYSSFEAPDVSERESQVALRLSKYMGKKMSARVARDIVNSYGDPGSLTGWNVFGIERCVRRGLIRWSLLSTCLPCDVINNISEFLDS